VAFIIIVIGIVIGGRLYGRYLASIDLAQREAQLEQLRAESQKQKRDIDGKSRQLTTLQAQLTQTQAALNAIMPSAPRESLDWTYYSDSSWANMLWQGDHAMRPLPVRAPSLSECSAYHEAGRCAAASRSS